MIFYFSGTGNTKWAAQELAKATNEPLFFIPDVLKGNCQFQLSEGERIGFCFPVHGWRPPFLVRDFIRKLVITNTQSHYCYALCTAGDTTGESMKIFEKDLSERGLDLNATFSLIMPESYVGLPFMDVDTPQKERQKKLQAAELLQVYIERIIRKEESNSNSHIGRWPRINSRLIGSFFVNHLISDKPFQVEESRCVKCGICANVCPTENITGGLGYEPKWIHEGACLTCFACYHHCPHHAIEFGKQTRKKGQYWYTKNRI